MHRGGRISPEKRQRRVCSWAAALRIRGGARARRGGSVGGDGAWHRGGAVAQGLRAGHGRTGDARRGGALVAAVLQERRRRKGRGEARCVTGRRIGPRRAGGRRRPAGARRQRRCRFGRTKSRASGAQGLRQLGLGRRVGCAGAGAARQQEE
jgi:hypothetical protein